MATCTASLSCFVVFLFYLIAQVPAKPKVAFTSRSSKKSETSGFVSISLERTVDTNIQTTVSLDLKGTATKDSDYLVVGSLVVTFPANDLSPQNISLFILNDELVEIGKRETIIVEIRKDAAINRKANYTRHRVYIADDDVSINCQNTQVSESAGTATVQIARSGSFRANRDTHSIECFTKDDSATAPSDYTTINSAFSFTNRNKVQRMSIAIKNDTIPEANENFKVRCFTRDVRVRINSSCDDAVVTIQNDDTYAFFCPGGYAKKVAENAGSFSVEICRVGVLDTSPTVKLCRTTEGGNSPSIIAECKDVAFTVNRDRVTAGIIIINDNKGDTEIQTFQIYLESSAVTINDTAHYDVTIQDNDNTFFLTSVSEIQVTEGVGSPNVTLTIRREGRTSIASSVSLELVFDTTAKSADCTGISPRLIEFEANETNRTITACTLVDDRLIEDDETFKVKISGVSSSNVRTGKSERTVKLISDDVNVGCQGSRLKEANGPATVRLDRTGATAVTANNISCSITNGTAFSPNDYMSQTSTTVSFALNQLTKNFPVVLTNDRVVETNESFTVTCNTSDPRVVVDPSCIGIQINITNDDTYVYFCPGYSTSIEENVGSYTVRLCRVGVLEDTHTVRLCRTSDSVFLPHDYPSVQARCDDIVFAAYETVKELVIPVTNDVWGEQEYKTFNVFIITTDSRVTFNDTTSYAVTIHDDDNTFCFKRTSATVYEEHDKFVNMTIRRMGAITVSNASVIIDTSPQTAITPEDYAEPILNLRLTFFVGEIEKHISVNIVNDKLVEDDQTFQLSLTAVNGSTEFPDCKTSSVTIVSNDVNMFCRDRRGHQRVYENSQGPVLMEFTREGSLQYNHTIRIRTIDGTAQSGKDYIAIDKTLTFAPYQTSLTENVVLVNDNVLEPDETFSLSVTSSDDRVHIICPGTEFTIIDDDTFIRCGNQSIEVSEGNKTVYLTLKREGVLNKASLIWFSTKDGSAVDKSDYKPQNQVNRTFLPDQVYMTLSVDLVDDEYKEDDETFSVIIGTYDHDTTLTSGGKCVIVTIKDDDPNRMTEQQAQALLLSRRLNFLIIIGVAGAFAILVLISVVCRMWYILRRAKK
ncbi:uncharacterized protein LOC116299471 [Actinia tenebrosa]|uniref:Uncharacterized protein LOC116299471 n=1 Tax=Actinia tenebrosa TaxID=6105 RepID=A0A6P8IE36_ACTTE|nr:uncharacterized protein LOC116299471 [Actinia tenebrosa]